MVSASGAVAPVKVVVVEEVAVVKVIVVERSVADAVSPVAGVGGGSTGVAVKGRVSAFVPKTATGQGVLLRELIL